MIYIIQGEEEIFVRNKINEFLNKENSDIFKFDGNDNNFSVDEMLNACVSNSFFSNKTIVLVKDAPFLTKKTDDKVLEKLTNYINNPIFETDLIFYSFSNKLNGKLKAYKVISKNAQVFNLEKINYYNFNNYVNQQLIINGIKMSKDASLILTDICKRDATLLNSNIEVLKNYPDEINTDVIIKLCTFSESDDAFELINSLTNKDVSKSISIFRKMCDEKDSIMPIIGLLSSQLRFLYQISYLNDLGKTTKEIIEITKCNEWRLKNCINTLNKISTYKILELLNDLSKIDIKCKNDNSISDKSYFELYILNLLKKDTYAIN